MVGMAGGGGVAKTHRFRCELTMRWGGVGVCVVRACVVSVGGWPGVVVSHIFATVLYYIIHITYNHISFILYYTYMYNILYYTYILYITYFYITDKKSGGDGRGW